MKVHTVFCKLSLVSVLLFVGACGGSSSSGNNAGDDTVLDNVTGLMWQKEDDNAIRAWSDAVAYCAALSLGGHTDWRLPARKELLSIVDYGQFSPAIDTTSFPNTNTSAYYWTSTEYVPDTSNVWFVEFDLGQSFNVPKTDEYYVRCVRGPSYSPDFTDNDDGTVTDNVTDLMWQQSHETAKTWQEAMDYCIGLSFAGYDDWLLPDIKELASITNDATSSPAIYATYFPATLASSDYWSSTTDAHNIVSAWRVRFDDGQLLAFPKTSDTYARCVR